MKADSNAYSDEFKQWFKEHEAECIVQPQGIF